MAKPGFTPAVAGLENTRPQAWIRAGSLFVAACMLQAVCAAEARAQAVDPVRRLAVLCEVWGLLKYYHPDVASRADWDDVLSAAVPRFKAADTRRELSAEVEALVSTAHPRYGFRDAETLGGRPLDPMFEWIRDAAVFEPDTRLLLAAIVHAHAPVSNRYVLPMRGAGNPDFSGDQAYAAAPAYPDEATRLLALFRFWNMVQYFFPYRDVIGRDWRQVLPELIPKFTGAAAALDYHRAVAEMTAQIHDTHAATNSAVLQSYFGRRSVPVHIRLIQRRTVVIRVFRELLDPGIDLRVGDVITHIGGVPVEARRAELRPLLGASNDVTLERNIHSRLRATNEARIALTIEDENGRSSTFDVNTVAPGAMTIPPGAVSAVLPGNIGYVHMGWLQPADVERVMAEMRTTGGLVFDVRNYPNFPNVTLYQISSYLNPRTPFVKFTKPDFDHPGRLLRTEPLFTSPSNAQAPFTYTGRVAILVNQETQSHAEFTVMNLQKAPGAIVIGSQTAGADGNVSAINLPGGLSTSFSGTGVFYPDGRPTQRIGIVPDVAREPTIRGLREGRDEVLEEAVARLTAR